MNTETNSSEGEGAPAPVKRQPKMPEGHVRVRVMRKGAERIFTGETCPLDDEKFPTHRRGDTLTMPRATAEKYEDDGWVEITDGPARD